MTDKVRRHLEQLTPDGLRKLGKTQGGWQHASSAEERGLERWMLALWKLEKKAALRAVIAAGDCVYPAAVKRAGKMALECGLAREAPSVDGDSTGKQLDRARAWLDGKDDLADSFDESRQLNVWDEDLTPAKGDEWMWLSEVGQMCLAAILKKDKAAESADGTYYTWPARLSCARGLVCAFKTSRAPKDKADQKLEALASAVRAAL